ncbi:Phosphoglycerate mutase-like protein 1 [Glycine soja]
MDCVAGSSLFPLHRCKTIHLVRHAQGIHNVEGDKNYNAYINPDYFDAHLTPLGWQQVDNLRKHVRDSGLINTIDLVIASPMMRTLQTAVGVFGGEAYTDKTDVLPLMVANAGNSYRAAISSLNSPPVVAVELCREHLRQFYYNCFIRFLKLDINIGIWGMVLTNFSMFSSCREFIPVTEEEVLASINFFFLLLISHWQVLRLQMPECLCLFKFLFQLDSDEDTWWKANVRETKEELAARGLKFLNCFANCELRSMVIVDRSMIGSELSTTNYPGKIPSGLDLPSDVADEKSEK